MPPQEKTRQASLEAAATWLRLAAERAESGEIANAIYSCHQAVRWLEEAARAKEAA